MSVTLWFSFQIFVVCGLFVFFLHLQTLECGDVHFSPTISVHLFFFFLLGGDEERVDLDLSLLGPENY